MVKLEEKNLDSPQLYLVQHLCNILYLHGNLDRRKTISIEESTKDTEKGTNRTEFMHTFKVWHCGSTCVSLWISVCVNVWDLWYRTVRFHCIQHAYCTKYIINDAKMFSAQCTCVLTYLCSSSIAFAMWWLFMFGLFHRFDASASRASAIKYNSLNHTDASGRIKLNDGRTAERRMQTEMSANSKNIVWGRERNPSNVKRFNNNIDKKVNANTLNTW